MSGAAPTRGAPAFTNAGPRPQRQGWRDIRQNPGGGGWALDSEPLFPEACSVVQILSDAHQLLLESEERYIDNYV